MIIKFNVDQHSGDAVKRKCPSWALVVKSSLDATVIIEGAIAPIERYFKSTSLALEAPVAWEFDPHSESKVFEIN